MSTLLVYNFHKFYMDHSSSVYPTSSLNLWAKIKYSIALVPLEFLAQTQETRLCGLPLALRNLGLVLEREEGGAPDLWLWLLLWAQVCIHFLVLLNLVSKIPPCSDFPFALLVWRFWSKLKPNQNNNKILNQSVCYFPIVGGENKHNS
jgi:hypothetical protein